MSQAASQLCKVLESLGESSQFCTAGSLTPVLPGLEVDGVGTVSIPVSAADARRLIEQASQAPYGRGEETIVNTNVRRVWQLEPRQFALYNAAWGEFVDGIVGAVRKEFGIGKKVQHELYKLLVYETGSFFAPHRDTEKMPGMFATLVVCLPSRHEGGTLIVTHDSETKRIDFGGDAAEFNVQYAAFYADCRHEITPVTSGYRVCLVYNLAIARQKTQPSAPVNSQAVDAVADLLPKFFVDGSQEISEATGNEGATMERWYHQAVVVIWPRDRYFRILAGKGPEHAVPALEELVSSTAKPQEDAACREFATEITRPRRP